MLRHLEEVFYPETLADAVRKKAEYAEAAAPIAGGTDLVPEAPPHIKCLIDLNRLNLNYIQESETELRIGACATMQQVTLSPAVALVGTGMLCSASCEGWPRQIRNAATIGGNLVSAGPFADTPPALLCLDARAVVVEQTGEREIPLEEFFLDYRRTAVGDGILKEVIVPKDKSRGVFLKYARTQVDQALVNAAVVVHVEDGRCRKARIALGAMGRTPRRVLEAEQILLDDGLNPESIGAAAARVAEVVDPVLDFRASADYRREVGAVLVRRALSQLSQAC